MSTLADSMLLHRIPSFRTVCLVLILISPFSQGFAQITQVLIDDNFASPGKHWKEIKLNNATDGQFAWDNFSLSVTNTSKTGLYGLYHVKPFSGNFYAEAEFTEDDAIGLVLIASKNGVPDPQNYTLIAVSNRSGITCINQYDRQNNTENVHDPKKVIDPSRYEAKLDSLTFSVPFRSTNKKIRILHESLSNTFHFYYGTRLNKWGMSSDDWMEVAPQYSWLSPDQQYFIALVGLVSEGQAQKAAVYTHVRVIQTPTDDQDDNGTGFKAEKRNFSWSGFEGDATVVSFGNEFGYDKNIKFVLWDRANNAPAWRLTNQFMLNFEFFEGGDSLYPGCHEAMSDRQRHGQTVTIVEDNAVRKIIRRHVMLVGVSEAYNYDGIKDQVQTWLDPGTITMADGNYEFVKIDRLYRSIILRSNSTLKECLFSITPATTLVNPTFTIENWKGDDKVEVFLNGSKTDVQTAKEGNALLVWIQASIHQLSTILIRPIP